MEKHIHGNLRLMKHHPVLELYLPKVTYKMKLIHIQVCTIIISLKVFSIYLPIFYIMLICRSNCIDTWAIYDGTRKTTLS